MTNSELEQLIRENGTAIYSFCRHLTCHVQEAEDLYQDTFLKAIELGTLKAGSNPKSCLLAIAVNIWKNRKRKFAWRRRITEEKALQEQSDPHYCIWMEPSPEAQVLKEEEQKIIRRLVDDLPEKFRVVVLLYYMEELSVPQISKVMKLPEGTIKSRLHKARKLLEQELSGYQ